MNLEPHGQPRFADWREGALITATLFFNVHFWVNYGGELGLFSAILPAVFATMLFFVGPAARGLPLESSVGSVPAAAVRVCAVTFLALWMAESIAFPGLGLVSTTRWPEMSFGEEGIVVIALLAFIVWTGLQSTKINAKLAVFGNKLGIAILVAALIRVHEGLPAAMNGFPQSDHSLPVIWIGLSRLLFYAAPLGFLAGSFGGGGGGRRELAKLAAWGFGVPLFVAVALVGVINAATLHSGYYQPSMAPNVLMALWVGASYYSLPGYKLVVAMTTFGSLRFGVRALVEVSRPLGGVPWLRMAGLALPIGWFSIHTGREYVEIEMEAAAACLVCVAAVVSADCVFRAPSAKNVRRFDWVGFASLFLGLACAACWNPTTGADAWTHTWVLPSYATAITACGLGRFFARAAAPYE